MPRRHTRTQDGDWSSIDVTPEVTNLFVWAWLTDLIYEWRDVLLSSVKTAATERLASQVVDGYDIGYALFADNPRRLTLLSQSTANSLHIIMQHDPDLGARMLEEPKLTGSLHDMITRCLSSFPRSWTKLEPPDPEVAPTFKALRAYCGQLLIAAMNSRQMQQLPSNRAHIKWAMEPFDTHLVVPDIDADLATTPEAASEPQPAVPQRLYQLTSWSEQAPADTISCVFKQFEALQRQMMDNVDAIRMRQQQIRHHELKEIRQQIIEEALSDKSDFIPRLIMSRTQQKLTKAQSALFGHLRQFTYDPDVPDINRLLLR